MLVNSYSVEREISGSISSVASTLRILKYLRNKGTSFALHCPTLRCHHDGYLSSPVSGRRQKKTKNSGVIDKYFLAKYIDTEIKSM